MKLGLRKPNAGLMKATDERGAFGVGSSDEGVLIRMQCEACGHHTELKAPPDQAEDIAVELRTRAIEVRQGGRET